MFILDLKNNEFNILSPIFLHLFVGSFPKTFFFQAHFFVVVWFLLMQIIMQTCLDANGLIEIHLNDDILMFMQNFVEQLNGVFLCTYFFFLQGINPYFSYLLFIMVL